MGECLLPRSVACERFFHDEKIASIYGFDCNDLICFSFPSPSISVLEEEDGDNDEGSGSAYRLKYERVARELEFTKKRLHTQHEHDLEQLVGLKKQLEKKLADAYEEVEEQRQVVAQWKRKNQKMSNEMNDLRMLLEEQNSRNNLLEKRQRKFDLECQSLQVKFDAPSHVCLMFKVFYSTGRCATRASSKRSAFKGERRSHRREVPAGTEPGGEFQGFSIRQLIKRLKFPGHSPWVGAQGGESFRAESWAGGTHVRWKHRGGNRATQALQVGLWEALQGARRRAGRAGWPDSS